MPVSRNVLSALAAAAAVGKVNAAFGSAFSTGPTSDDTFITESWATLNLPTAPTDNSGDLSLWVGMGTSNGDLIQSIADNYDSDDWSLFAYTLVSTSDSTQTPIQADGSTAPAGTAVTFHYVYDASTGNYTQDVIVDGSVISTLSTSDGEAQGWGSAVECAATDCGSVPAHTWTNVSIILSGADTDYINTLSLGEGVEATMTSSDGITWEVGTITIPGYDFSTSSVTDDTVDTSSASTSTSSVSTSTASSSAGSSGDSSSSSSGSSAATPSGTATTGSGSSTWDSAGAQSSGTSGGSPTWGSAGSQPSGTSGGSSTWGSAGAQSSGSWGGFGGFGGFGGSSGQHSGSSPMASAGASTNSFAGWGRSRISRHVAQN